MSLKRKRGLKFNPGLEPIGLRITEPRAQISMGEVRYLFSIYFLGHAVQKELSGVRTCHKSFYFTPLGCYTRYTFASQVFFKSRCDPLNVNTDLVL